jgi:hydroxylamine reductase (hybrid-cluster protein)
MAEPTIDDIMDKTLHDPRCEVRGCSANASHFATWHDGCKFAGDCYICYNCYVRTQKFLDAGVPCNICGQKFKIAAPDGYFKKMVSIY